MNIEINIKLLLRYLKQTTMILITLIGFGGRLVAQNYICPGESYTLTAQAGLTNYQWYTISAVPDTIAISGANTQTYIATVAGKYYYTAKDANLCTVTLCTPLVISSNPCCKPNAGIDRITCSGTIVTLTGTTPNTGTWSAKVGNPLGASVGTTTSGVTNITFNSTASGNYYFIYSIGGTCNDTMLVTVNNLTVDAGTDKNLTCTTTNALIGTVSVVGNTYSWSPSTGLSSTTIAQPTASPSATTSYTVTATGANGCTASDVVVVNVNTSLPTVDAGLDKTISCSTTSTSIGTVSVVGNTYNWSPSTGLSSTTIAQPTASPSATTSYTVTATGANGCTATDVVVVNVNTTIPIVDAGTDKNLTCTTTSSVIGTVSVVGNTYSWSPSTGLSSTTIAQPTASPSATTSYTVTATGANGCTATDVVVVNVNTILPTVDAGTDKNLTCTTTSTVIGTVSLVGNSYSWSPSTGLSSTTIAQPTATPSATTSYTVTVTGANGCTATDVVVVNVNTTLPTVDAGLDKTISCSTTSTSIGTVSVVGNTYNWSPSTGLSSTTIAQPTATPSATTSYTVTVTGANGCTATDVVVVAYDSARGTIGNYVWFDFNHNGQNDETSSNGINGVTVELYKETSPGNFQLYQTTITSNNGGNPGYYSFVVCNSGNYKVKFPLTNGVNALTLQTNTLVTDNNSDPSTASGFTNVFTIDIYGTSTAKDNLTIDAGYQFVCPIPNCGTGTIIKN